MHAIAQAGDLDRLSFSLDGLSTVMIEITETDQAPNFPTLDLLDAQGTPIESTFEAVPTARINRECGLDALESGSYLLQVGDLLSDTFDYNITLTCLPCSIANPTVPPTATPVPTATLVPTDTFEPDDSVAQPGLIRCGETQMHTIAPEGDGDWDQFSLDGLSTVIIETSAADSADVALILFDAQGAPIEFNEPELSGRIDRQCGVDALPAGTYFVRVNASGFFHYTFAYDVTLTCLPCATPNPTPTPTTTPLPTATASPTITPDARGNRCFSDEDCADQFGFCQCCAEGVRKCSAFCFPGDCSGPLPTPRPPTCGDGHLDVELGEECDDGNVFGGDGCAANCTQETARRFVLGPETFLQVQIPPDVSPISLPPIPSCLAPHNDILGCVRGSVTFSMGRPGSNGDIPLAVPADGLAFEPISVPLLGVCACLLGLDARAASAAFGFDVDFGAGNTADGVIACGPSGLSGVNYNIVSPEPTPPSGLTNAGRGRSGSGRLRVFLGLNVLNGDCSFGNPDNGPDGIACTPDDEPLFGIGLAELTTGAASAAILNADFVDGQNVGLGCQSDCDRDGSVRAHELVRSLRIAFGSTPDLGCPLIKPAGRKPVVGKAIHELFGCGLSGQPFDCDALARGGAGMARLAFAAPAAGGVLGFDSVLGGEIELLADVAPIPSPTSTVTAPATPTATSTSAPTGTPTPTPSPPPTIPGAPTATLTNTPPPTPTSTPPPTPTPCRTSSDRRCCSAADCTEHPGGECFCCQRSKTLNMLRCVYRSSNPKKTPSLVCQSGIPGNPGCE